MDTVLIVVTWVVALGVAVIGGWPLTVLVLRQASRSTDSGAEPLLTEDEQVAGTSPAPAEPVPPAGARPGLRGGTWIGYLERAATTGAVLAGFPAAVAFVIAVKGLGRYPELRTHPEVSERFVIGTLTSLLWAASIGAAGRLVLQHL